MSKKNNLIGAISAIVGMFLWVFLTVALTGGRDLQDFSDRDWLIFYGFIAVEVITVVLAFYFAVRAGRETRGQKPAKVRASQASVSAWGIVCILLAVGACLGGMTLGEFFAGKIPRPVAILGVILSGSVPFVGVAVNCVLCKRYRRKLDAMSVAEGQQFFLSHREHAAHTTQEKQKILLKLQRQIGLWALVLGLFGLLAAFFAGAVDTSLLAYIGLFGMIPALSRFRFPQKKAFFAQYAQPEDYPRLYALAQQARDAMGCQGQVHIAFDSDCNAGIADVNGAYSIQLGTTLLKLLNEQELYACLLHEFGHIRCRTPQRKKVENYCLWVQTQAGRYLMSNIHDLVFLYPTVRYAVEQTIYRFACSVDEEAQADRQAMEKADRKAMASLLLKLKYHELYEWERPGHADDSQFAAETIQKDFLHRDLIQLYSAFAKGEERWSKLTDAELLARNASHPTTKMRLDELEIKERTLLPFAQAGEYAAEVEKALCHVEQQICAAIEPEYAHLHRERYLKPLERISQWERDGKPITQTTYADLINDLMLLGRSEEAEALCDETMATLSDDAARFGCYQKGQFLLHRYDPAGVALIYEAMQNSNYLEEGLQTIGTFACIIGDRQLLEEYREKALELGQKQKDLYRKLGELLPSDDLSAEQLPPELLQGILDCVAAMKNDPVQEVYLLHKQITDSFFTSAVVLRYRQTASQEDRGDGENAMFRYLDAQQWQFSLFDYDDVRSVRPERIDGSRIYSKE